MDVNLEAFKTDNQDFQQVQNLTMGAADLKQFMPLRNHLVVVAQNCGTERNLSCLISTHSKDIGEQLKLTDNVVNLVV